MMQQRLKAKLMVVRWGSEAVPGAGWVSNVSKAPWKGKALPGRAAGQGDMGRTLRSWGAQCGSGMEWKWIFFFCSFFSLDSAENSSFMTKVTSGLASHGSQSFPPEHRQGHKHGCIFVPPVLRSALSCCPPAGSQRGILSAEFIPSYSQPDNWAPGSLYWPPTSSALPFFMHLAESCQAAVNHLGMVRLSCKPAKTFVRAYSTGCILTWMNVGKLGIHII